MVTVDTRPLVLVTFGTDHHHFDRLMRWLSRWYDTLDTPEAVRVVVQHGPTAADPRFEGHEFFPREELSALMGEATSVVCSCGPGAVMTARAAGIRPVVVPRVAGECVDDHQQAFASHLGRHGLAVNADDEAALVAAINDDLADPAAARVAPEDRPAVGAGVARIGALIDELAPRR